jgi:hypothetical protein
LGYYWRDPALSDFPKLTPFEARDAAQEAGKSPDASPEEDHAKGIFEAAPAEDPRPDLPDQAMTLDAAPAFSAARTAA